MTADPSAVELDPADLVNLAAESPSSPESTLRLCSALHALVSQLLLPVHPDVAKLAVFFSATFFPGLITVATDAHVVARVADILLDVVWQLDQQIENSAVQYEAVGEGDSRSVVAAEERKALEVQGRLRLAHFVKLLIAANVLSVVACVERLETTFIALPSLALLADQPSFARLEVRSRTALLYKQQKFNLFREESEGYAKLVVELLSNLGPPHSVIDAKSQEGERERISRARLVGDSVKSLIGNFDLDPDRTLDIILDTFSDQIVQHHQFFIDFLAVSPWAPKAKSAPSSNVAHAAMEVDGMSDEKGKAKAQEPLVNVGLEGDTGSFLIGQILGFKFKFYQRPDSGPEDAPEKLYLMAALLIWHGFVKLSDLWSHLSPDDQELSKVESRYRDTQEQLARSVGGSNALALAGALVDDDAPSRPSSSAAAAAQATLDAAAAAQRELPNQKLALLRAMLSVGDLPHSFFVLSQFPVLVPANTDLADLLLRLLGESIAPAYESISIAKTKEQFQADFHAQKIKYVPSSSSSKPLPPTQPFRYLSGRAFSDPNKDYTFFFAPWAEKVPKAGDWAEVLDVVEMYLPFVGAHVSRNFPLFSKLCRIISTDLKGKPSNPRAARWFEVLRQYLLPSISLLENHSVAALEIWTVLSLFPVEARYKLYGEWKDSMYRRIPVLSVRKAEAERDIKNILRRLSIDNVKKLGKTLARVTHTNPTIIFAVILNQVQSYDNLIVPVVDAARYLSPFGYDVMTFSLLDALSAGKAKTKDDGTSVAMWLQGLASFTGQLYRKWSALAPSLSVVFQYMVNQLVSGNSKDLVILREIITRMTGIEPFADLSDAQVNSLGGGRLLRAEVFFQTELEQASNKLAMNSLRAARARLVSGLRNSGLIIPLLVNIAIQRQACVSDAETHLKSLGGRFDQCHAVLFQYMELLRLEFSPEELAALVPTISDLMERFGVEAAVAFDIARPRLRLAMAIHDEKAAKNLESTRKVDLMAKLAREKAVAAESPKLDETKPLEGDLVKSEDVEASPTTPLASNAGLSDVTMSDSTLVAASPARVPTSPWHPALLGVIETANNVLPENVRSIMGSAFFVTFWQLTLYDVVYPKQSYDSELKRCASLQKDATASTTLSPTDRDSFVKSVITLANGLTEEAVKHSSVKTVTNRRLGREKLSWFGHIKTSNERNVLVDQVVQFCLQPRAKLSLPDAVFCYDFFKRLHSMNTPGFHTVVCYDKLLSQQLGPLLYSCTENEARNYGRFLHDILRDLHQWNNSEELYKAEAVSMPLQGFLKRFPGSASPPPTAEDYHSHAELRNLVHKWHSNMTSTFRQGFASGEYMHIKNSILVLTKIAPFFPLHYNVGTKLEQGVSSLIRIEKREDLKILAYGYKAVLAKRRKHWTDQPKLESIPSVPKPVSKLNSAPTTTSAPAVSASTSPNPRLPPSAPASSASALPTGPKFAGLPQRPGVPSTGVFNNGNAPRPSAAAPRSEFDSKPVPMDVDTGAPHSVSSRQTQEPSRRNQEFNSNPAATSSASNPSRDPGNASPSSSSQLPRIHASLPQRPGQSNGPTVPTNELLRQQALASQQAGASKRSASTPSNSAVPLTAGAPSRREPGSSSTSSAPRDNPPPQSTNQAARESESGSREKGSRENERSAARRSRDPSPDSAGSSRHRRSVDKEPHSSKERPTESRSRDERNGTSRNEARPPRDSRNSRDVRDSKDSRDTRDSRDSRDVRDSRDKGSRDSRDPHSRDPRNDDRRTSSKAGSNEKGSNEKDRGNVSEGERVGEKEKTDRHSTTPKDGAHLPRSEERGSETRRRDPEPSNDLRRPPSSSISSLEKEKPRSDSRSGDNKPRDSRSSHEPSTSRRNDAHPPPGSGRHNVDLPPHQRPSHTSRGHNEPSRVAPTGPKAERKGEFRPPPAQPGPPSTVSDRPPGQNLGERLRPAPAMASASTSAPAPRFSVPPPPPPSSSSTPTPATATSAAPGEAISIKGRSRIFGAAMDIGSSSREGSGRRSSGSGSRSREESSGRREEEDSRKRPASGSSLADRLAVTEHDGQSKRARTGDKAADESDSRRGSRR